MDQPTAQGLRDRLPAALTVGAVAICALIADVLLPLGVAAGVPYVVLVLLAFPLRDPRSTMSLAALGSLLTVAGIFLGTALYRATTRWH